MNNLKQFIGVVFALVLAALAITGVMALFAEDEFVTKSLMVPIRKERVIINGHFETVYIYRKP